VFLDRNIHAIHPLNVIHNSVSFWNFHKQNTNCVEVGQKRITQLVLVGNEMICDTVYVLFVNILYVIKFEGCRTE
jgi:hypothetical protein